MTSPAFDDPRLVVVKHGDLPLEGKAVMVLMSAVLGRGLPFRFRAGGWSMSPFIRDGDVLTVAPLGRALPAPGDVIAFAHPANNSLVVHRVVALRDDACLVRGDNARSESDGWIERRSMLGVVTRVERGRGRAHLGMGPERRLIAALSRRGLLWPLIFWAQRFRRLVVGRASQ